jgi:hypothetical protein
MGMKTIETTTKKPTRAELKRKYLTRLKSRRTRLRRELADFEDIERHVYHHSPERDRKAVERWNDEAAAIEKISKEIESLTQTKEGH